jgi:hypothetical protein
MMRLHVAGPLAVCVLITIGCGRSGSSGGAVTVPTAPSVSGAQPASVNVGGGPQTPVQWNGTASDDQAGSGTVELGLQQIGSQVTGSLYVQVLGHSGPISGTVSGNTLTFNFSVGNSGQGCGDAISGTATVISSNTMTPRPNTMNTMTGTFSGKDCTGNPVTNGAFTVSLQDPTLQDQTASATRFPVAGTWKSPLPPALGGGSWTWTLAQAGDVNGGALTGSVTISADNTLNLGAGTVTGTFANVFPGPPEWVSAVTNVSFAGACPATLTITWGDLTSRLSALSPDGLHLIAATFSGSNCNGPFGPLKPSLTRQ